MLRVLQVFGTAWVKFINDCLHFVGPFLLNRTCPLCGALCGVRPKQPGFLIAMVFILLAMACNLLASLLLVVRPGAPSSVLPPTSGSMEFFFAKLQDCQLCEWRGLRRRRGKACAPKGLMQQWESCVLWGADTFRRATGTVSKRSDDNIIMF